MIPRAKLAPLLLSILPFLLSLPASAEGQELAPDTAVSDTAAAAIATPTGAFLRSLAIPGWGQAAVGSYDRAGFYFLTSGTTLWMLLKTSHHLNAAEERLDLVELEIEQELLRRGVSDPDSLLARLDADERVEGLRGLVDSRSQQMEDWTAFGIFWLLLNAADAFVSAHLAGFPEPVEIDVRSGLPGQGGELRISIPVGGPAGR